MPEASANPTLNSPYDPPEHHFECMPHGRTGEMKEDRRPSESFIPITAVRNGMKLCGGGRQQTIDFDLTGERREQNSLINDLRDVDQPEARRFDGGKVAHARANPDEARRRPAR